MKFALLPLRLLFVILGTSFGFSTHAQVSESQRKLLHVRLLEAKQGRCKWCAGCGRAYASFEFATDCGIAPDDLIVGAKYQVWYVAQKAQRSLASQTKVEPTKEALTECHVKLAENPKLLPPAFILPGLYSAEPLERWSQCQ